MKEYPYECVVKPLGSWEESWGDGGRPWEKWTHMWGDPRGCGAGPPPGEMESCSQGSEGAGTGGPWAGGCARLMAATCLLSSSAVMSTVVITSVAGEGCSWPSVTAETWGHMGARCLAPAPTAPALSHSQHHGGPMAKSLDGEEEALGTCHREDHPREPQSLTKVHLDPCEWLAMERDSPESCQSSEPSLLWHWLLPTPYLWLWQ